METPSMPPPPDTPPPAPPAPPTEPEQEPPSSPKAADVDAPPEDNGTQPAAVDAPQDTETPPAAVDAPEGEEEKVSLHQMEAGGYVEEENGHSMPNLEEARTEGVICAGGAYNKHYDISRLLKDKRGVALVALVFVTVALIVGFSAALAQSNKALSNAGEPEDPSLGGSREISRFRDVTEFLSVKITQLSLLQNNDTPQYKAALWIADQDEANLPIPAKPNNYEMAFDFVQRYIMAVFYFSLDGPNWIRKANFLSGSSVCDWHFDLDPNTAPAHAHKSNWKFGVQCVGNRVGDAITHIFMTDNGLKGELPREMGDLLDLRHLSLYKNDIDGGLPEQFRHYGNLDFVALESNRLAGPLPEWINGWTNLKYLALGDNRLTGTLPNLSGLTNLEELALEDNKFEGRIFPIESLKKMKKLYLSNNEFTGRVHDKTFQDFANLQIVDLSRNKLTGYFPAHFYNLQEVDLHMNQINDAPLPDITSDNLGSPLRYLSVYANKIPGPVPNTLGFLSSLEHLDLSENQFTGPITDTFDNLKSIKSLYLSFNPFDEGAIPELRGCRNLEALSMTETNRNGYIHMWMGSSFPNLQLLDLHDNRLTGTIPTTFGDLSNLKLLFLNHNFLTGGVPTELAEMPNIVTFMAHSNELTGSFDPVCAAQPEKLAFFVTDCDSEVTCGCCTTCCASFDTSCVNNDSNMDTLNMETSREAYMFSENVIFKNSVGPE